MGSTTDHFVDEVVSQKYNVIIVGGGTAGLVAAARLTEGSSNRVLVIDAGKDRRGDPIIDTPGLMSMAWGNPDYDWGYWTQPQEHVNGREIPQPRGNVLGGSSAINVTAMAYPTPRNLEHWAKLGNKGWCHDEMLSYYKRTESYTPPSQSTAILLESDRRLDPNLHGKSGPLRTTFPDAYSPWNQAWLHAFDSAGFAKTSDPILGRHQGAFTPPNTVDAKTFQRSYAASAFYSTEIEQRTNLFLMAETFVNRILFKSPGGVGAILEAVGVEVTLPGGKVVSIDADEVVLAAGALQSPVVLENSGVGPKEVLKKHGIEVLVDNAGVGENLQDHFFTTVSFEIADDQTSADIVRDPAVVDALLKQYAESRSGPLSGVPLSLAFTPPVDIHGLLKEADVQSLIQSNEVDAVAPGLAAQYEELKATLGDSEESSLFFGLMGSQMHVKPSGRTSMPEAYSQQLDKNFVSVMVGLNHPFSRGSVHTAGKDPTLHPVIDPKYLSHPLDLEVLARGTQFIEHLVGQPPLKKLLKGPDGHFLPEYASTLEPLENAKRVVRDRLWTTYHPCCTCPMMPREAGGVVSDRLIVHGTSNVRVIDASIFPMIPMGNIQATVYAVAEKASDMIKEDWAA